VVAGFLPRCTALVSANLLCNGIGTEQAAALAAVVKEHGTLVSVCGLRGSETAVDMSGKGLGAEDVVLLAGELASMEGTPKLKVLNLSQNNIKGAEAGEALARALATNSVLEELDVSGNDCGSDFIKGLSRGLAKNQGLWKLDITGSTFDDEGKAVLAEALAQSVVKLLYCNHWTITDDGTGLTLLKHKRRLSDWDSSSEADMRLVASFFSRSELTKLTTCGGNAAVTMEAGMTELDLSGKRLEMAEAMAVVMALPRCNMLKKLMLSGEKAEQAHEFAPLVSPAPAPAPVPFGSPAPAFGAPAAAPSMFGAPAAAPAAPFSFGAGGFGSSLSLAPTGPAVTMEVGMTELDLSGTGLGAAGAAVVAGFLPRCTVRGLRGSDTAVDMSGKGLGAEDGAFGASAAGGFGASAPAASGFMQPAASDPFGGGGSKSSRSSRNRKNKKKGGRR
jgi:hypothetical protein